MDRRQFLTLGATASVLGASSVIAGPAWAWPKDCITRLPKSAHPRMAWTLDDGSSLSAMKSYVKLLQDHDHLKMTFFVLQAAPAWKALARPITELVEAGRVQLGNHTWQHKSLTSLSNAHIKEQLTHCSKFIEDTFGVSAGTYYRPPYGNIDSRVIKVAREVGYTTPVLWYGSTGAGDKEGVAGNWRMCQKWMHDGRIVIDHSNSDVTVKNFTRVLALLKSRNLETVTLQDVFGAGSH
ncbi:MAG: polysaccharide deacetylase family protein [Rhodoluna sp.]|nr:polysaccharide deacetylase family protein [Rhodoluna sp.]